MIVAKFARDDFAIFILGNNGSTSTHTLNIADSATFTTGTGTTTINATGTVNLNTGATLRARHIDHTHGGAFNFTGGNLSVDTFTGNLTNTGGNLRPGGTPGDSDMVGTTTINGDYTQQAGATLALGTRSNGTIDKLDVNGTLSLDGALVVSAEHGFDGSIGDRLDLLDWDTLSGTFASIALLNLAAKGVSGAGWNTQDLYTTGELRIELTGDLNTDGFVGIEDLDIILANWNAVTHAYDYASGDVSGDGVIDATDLQQVIDNWGNGTTPGGNVPEPGSLAVIGLGGLAWLRRRRA